MSGPRRVLYFNTWSSAHGGSSTSLIDIVRSLDRHRFEPLVVCPALGELPRRLTAIGVPVIVHPMSRFCREEVWDFLREVPWYLRLLHRERIALVHGNTSSSRRSLLQATVLAQRPYVQHVRNGAHAPRLKLGCRYAARIVTNSNGSADELYADPILARKTVTIYNAVDLSAYEAKDDRRTEIGGGSRPIVGFVGQIVPRKGLLTLLRAFAAVLAKVPDAWLVIVGCAPPGETEYEEACRAAAVELGIQDSVRFIGYRHDVPAWMRTFDVFALPTRAEPFGKVIIEAMAAGCPVVASRVGGIPEIVTGPELGTLIEPDQEAEVARGILEFLTDRVRAARVAENGRRHAFSSFGLPGMMARLQELYDEVLATRLPGRAQAVPAASNDQHGVSRRESHSAGGVR